MTANVRALCRCGIRIPYARNRCPAFDKDKYLEPMFGVVGQARTNAAMLLMPIAKTSSRTCTKPTVSSCFSQSNRTLKYISVKIISDENKIVKPKFPKLNLVSNLYFFDTL